MENRGDVIIIGGGIIGCAAAYYLRKKGCSVIVLEGSKDIGNGGSSRNGGGVRQSGRGSGKPGHCGNGRRGYSHAAGHAGGPCHRGPAAYV